MSPLIKAKIINSDTPYSERMQGGERERTIQGLLPVFPLDSLSLSGIVTIICYCVASKKILYSRRGF